jgi:hypothetical protein
MAAKQATKGMCAADELEALKTASNHKRWIDTVEPEKRAELEEIRRRWHAGRLADKSIKFIYEWCCRKLGLGISLTVFREWLKEKVTP